MTESARPINILLVEDNADDVELTLRALQRAKVQNRVWTISNGKDALAFLRGQPPHDTAPRPDLVLLDLNLPGLDGRDVLLQIREDPELRKLAVVVLTASDEDREHLAALAADAFLTKPVDLERLGWLVRVMANLGWAIVKTGD
ncbi:MAG TPA: response regulator [Gemmatimonadales bacterium]|nr:response regulator [Gemmatimonadales bacterium]